MMMLHQQTSLLVSSSDCYILAFVLTLFVNLNQQLLRARLPLVSVIIIARNMLLIFCHFPINAGMIVYRDALIHLYLYNHYHPRHSNQHQIKLYISRSEGAMTVHQNYCIILNH